MKYIIEVYSKDGIVYYYHPSAFGDMISNNFVRAYDEGFDTVEEAKGYFNSTQKSFKINTLGMTVVAVKIVSVQATKEDVCELAIKDVCKVK